MTNIERLDRNLSQSLRQLQITESLLFLNKVLAVSRGLLNDPETALFLNRMDRKVPTFVVHLIVKYLMKRGRANTPDRLDWSNFPAVLAHAFSLAVADPISDSSDAQVLGALVRITSQQRRRPIPAQNYGLAIGLFQDLDPVTGRKPIDLRHEVEAALNMPIELFMRLGNAAHAAACATHGRARLPGTLNLDWLAKAATDLPQVPWVERWSEFARVTAKDSKAFDATPPGRSGDPFTAYRFNPLLRHPIIQVAHDRFIAVDPWLLVERTSWGVFYDIFEKYQGSSEFQKFTESFGYAFERFVDNLLQSIIPSERIWREPTSKIIASRIGGGSGKSSHKVGDLAVASIATSVMIECSSKRPTRDLCETAQPENLEKAAKAIAEELRQTFQHINAIQADSWSQEGLHPGTWVSLVITFGRFEMINSILFRKLIDKHFADEPQFPYLVLSLIELDHVVRLVENGHDFGTVIAKCAAVPSYDPVGDLYADELRVDAVSSFAKQRTERMSPTADELPQSAELR